MSTNVTRRGMLSASMGGLAIYQLNDHAEGTQSATVRSSPPSLGPIEIVLRINGGTVPLSVDIRASLLDALREQAGLTGTKKGCYRGVCGACTVHIDGRRVLACLTLAARCQGKTITTIEGLAGGEGLHPVQAAFLRRDGLQCGYCTPGQIMSAAALIREGHTGSDAEIRDAIVERQRRGADRTRRPRRCRSVGHPGRRRQLAS
jgi:xanthine dehydrogenase YagT iron-sulfur-binding subunit